ncbi:Probable RNA-directed DNA polymerase from transposon BS [Eumeta japonica]|uniref:Probable RNA-directed DNA polymerase from transposon BS n=1 Tax=Eumeta variegata TaxID=151549 RepID=A0A4C1XHW8_EUMVA|nr:Probable RNA-directed DNA polymerase from transposon BS [Eumeta japonica]
MEEVKNENWSELMVEISPNHQAYWGLAKAIETEGAVPFPAMRKPDKSVAFDDWEKAEYIADSIEQQCSENTQYDLEHVRRVEEEPNHSYPQQALRLIEYISEGFKTKKKSVAVFFHIAKAFDRVCNRHFTFRLYNTYSPMRPIRAGVSQGSTPSPLLYSTSVNDIPRPSTGVQLALFADDTALFLRSNCLRNILPRLQKAIEELTRRAGFDSEE